jgi:hypothetical protein
VRAGADVREYHLGAARRVGAVGADRTAFGHVLAVQAQAEALGPFAAELEDRDHRLAVLGGAAVLRACGDQPQRAEAELKRLWATEPWYGPYITSGCVV